MGKDMEQGVAPVVLYGTEMLRWGSEEDHHYVHGVYSTRAAAAKAGAWSSPGVAASTSQESLSASWTASRRKRNWPTTAVFSERRRNSHG